MDRKRIKYFLNELSTYDFSLFSVPSFIEWLEKRIGRKIVLIPWVMEPWEFAAWISDRDEPTEYIFFDKYAPPLQKIHSQLHECCHILCGHPTLVITRDELGNLSQYSSIFQQQKKPDFEAEAEFVSAMVQNLAIKNNRKKQLTQDMMKSVDLGQYLKNVGVINEPNC